MKNFGLQTTASFIILSIAILCAPNVVYAKKLFVPFTSQAPMGDWRQPWQDACEESTIVMVDRFYSDKQITQEQAVDAIRHVFNLKKNLYGYSLDEEAEKIVGIINNYYFWEAYIVESPTVDDIKTEIDAGRPVILPAHGKSLHNPYFISGGPDYHTVVISGYNDERKMFITQEPGTRHGLDFEYGYDTLLTAMHNYLPANKTKTGKKLAIFTRKQATDYLDLDADKDGLNKGDELAHGSVLWLADSDGDGYSDGAEVSAGYSPVRAEYQPKNGDLIMVSGDPKVYLVENGQRRHILNEAVFKAHKWSWESIRIIEKTVLEKTKEGTILSI